MGASVQPERCLAQKRAQKICLSLFIVELKRRSCRAPEMPGTSLRSKETADFNDCPFRDGLFEGNGAMPEGAITGMTACNKARQARVDF